MTDVDSELLEQVIAKEAIREVMNRWCRVVDRCDWQSVYSIFHPEGSDNHGLYNGDVDGMIAWLSERHKAISRSMHLVANMLFEFKDTENCLVESYTLAVQRYKSEGGETLKAISGDSEVASGEVDMLVTGRYVDHFLKRDGEWRILNRTVIFDNTMVLPVGENAPKMGEDWHVSARGDSDPIWSIRRQLGLS